MPSSPSRRCLITVNHSVSPTENTGSTPVADAKPSISRWQSVLGTTTAHSRTCDGSIPSAATSAPRPRGFHPRARDLFHPLRRQPSGCSSVVRARGRGPRGRWCDSSHSDDRHRPADGTRDYESRWLRFESSRWLACENTTVPWRDTILRRSLAEVRILSVVLLRRRLGRPWTPNPGSSVRFTGGVLCLDLGPGRRVV
jgi:hypothetical protein